MRIIVELANGRFEGMNRNKNKSSDFMLQILFNYFYIRRHRMYTKFFNKLLQTAVLQADDQSCQQTS